MVFRRRQGKSAQRLGVARIGSTAAAVRVAHPAEGRPRVDWHWTAPAQGLTEVIRDVRRAHGRRSPLASLTLDRGEYALVSTLAPEVPREEWPDALRWNLRDQVDFTVDDAIIDVLALPEAPQSRGSRTCIAMLVPGAQARNIHLLSDDEGQAWSAMEVPETALRNICALGEVDDKAHALMVFGEDHGMLVITCQGELLMARTIEVVAGAVAGAVEGRGNAVGRAGLEVLRTLDTFERMHSQFSLSGLTVASPEGAEGMVEVLADLVYVPVSQLCLSNYLDIDESSDAGRALAQSPTFSQLCALGAALREQGERLGRQQVKLLPPQQSMGPEPWGMDFGVKLVAGVAASVVVVSVGLKSAAQHGVGKAELAEKMLASLPGGAPQGAPRPPAMVELEALRDTEKQQRTLYETIQRLSTSPGTAYSEYFKALSRQSPGDLWITGVTIAPNGQDIELSGRMLNPAMLPSYLARLGQEPHFKGRRFAQVDMSALGAEQLPQLAGVTAFTLKAKVGAIPVSGQASAVAPGGQP